jgi:hypothetical protein
MEVTLQPGEAARMVAAGATRIRCVAGVLWMVGQRDGQDLLLEAGDSAELAPAQQHYLSSVRRNAIVRFDVSCGTAQLARCRGRRWRGWLGRLAHLA